MSNASKFPSNQPDAMDATQTTKGFDFRCFHETRAASNNGMDKQTMPNQLIGKGYMMVFMRPS